jgi:hypothetical protein
MPKNYSIVDEFIAKAGLSPDQAGAMNALIDELKSRGQYVEKGDMKAQLIEKTLVKDKNNVTIEVSTCTVCGNEQFEVKP